ncbi:RNA-binding protein 42-like isoform X1 [Balamuthia mandrillaris]
MDSFSAQQKQGTKRKLEHVVERQAVVAEKAPVIRTEIASSPATLNPTTTSTTPNRPLSSHATTTSFVTSYPPYPSVPVVIAPAPSQPRPGVKVGTRGPAPVHRKAAGTTWEDPTLAEWPENDFRIFVGDLGNEVNDEMLKGAFSKYPSYLKSRVVRDKRTTKTKGYGFVSFSDPRDYIQALREMNGKYLGNRPMKLRKSRWKDFLDEEKVKSTSSNKQQSSKQTKKKRTRGPNHVGL